MIVLRDPRAITATPMHASILVKSLVFHDGPPAAAH